MSSQDSTVPPYHGSSVGLDGPQSDLNHWPSGWKASVITTRLWGHHGILPICMWPECSMPQGTELSIIARANVFWTNTHAGNAECSISQVRERNIIMSSQDSTVLPYHGSSVGLDRPQSDLNHWPSGWKASVITTRLWGHHGILPIYACDQSVPCDKWQSLAL